MIGALVVEDIFQDPNFRKLAEEKTDNDEFCELVESNVYGYSQKKRLCDGLKEFAKKVEEAENKVIIMQNVGKFKEPDPEVIILTSSFSSHDVKAKWSTVNAQLNPMIEAGSITSFERRDVIDNLRTRLDKAKEAGKDKLSEKLDGLLSCVTKAQGFHLPVENLEEFHQLDKEIQAIEKLARLSTKTLSKELQSRLDKKEELESEYEALIDTSRIWFETVVEFKARLQEALADFLVRQQERIKQMEAEALDRQIKADQDAMEQKRLEALRKEEEKHKELDEKLNQRRLEAAAKPVKEVPKAAPKEKKAAAKINLVSMFEDDKVNDYDIISPEEIAADLEAKRLEKEREERKKLGKAALKQLDSASSKPGKPSAKGVSTGAGEKAAPLKFKSDAQIAAEEQAAAKKQEEKAAALEAKLAAKRLEGESKPDKPAAQPKKKEKKAATKMSLLDFYADDDILDKLAAQEAQEKIERAKAEMERQKEEAKQAKEEEAAWEEDGAAWAAYEAETSAAPALKTLTSSAPSSAAAVPNPTASAPQAKPKAQRKPPAVLENKWGAPVGHAVLDDDILERLAAQEAQEKIERAAAKKAAEEEAALLAAEEDEMWAEPGTKIIAPPTKATASTAKVINDPTARVTAASMTLSQAPKPKRKPPVDKPSIWGVPTPQAARAEEEDKDTADGDDTAAAGYPAPATSTPAMPSLAESLTMPAPKKSPAPQPKKKEKKKWGKVDASLIGFDTDNLNT